MFFFLLLCIELMILMCLLLICFQVGSYFVKQYYQVLQQQPDFVHQFYTDESTVVRIDGDSSESASALLVML